MSSSSESEDEFIGISPEALEFFISPFPYPDALLVTGVLRAIVDKDLRKVKYLIEVEKCPIISDNFGNTPLHIAAANNSADIATYLLDLQYDIVDERNFYGETALFHAASRGHLDVAKTLTDANANVNIPNLEGTTPLHKAAHCPEIAHLLLQNGADVNAGDIDGETPLHDAVCERCDGLETSKCIEVVCMLLFYEADANLQCKNGQTALVKAIFLRRDDIQSILLDYIVDVNESVFDRIPTLGWALIYESPFVESILKAGASVNYKNSPSNAVAACLLAPNIKNFKLIWKHFKYQKLHVEKTYLNLLKACLTDDELFEYLEVIIDSNNLKPLFHKFDSNRLFRIVLKANKPKQSWLNITCNLLHLYLCMGHLPDVCMLFRVFWTFGYSELFYLCLHLDFKSETTIPAQHIPLLLYQPLVPMSLFKKFVALRILYSTPDCIREYLPYIRLIPYYSQHYLPQVQENDMDRIMQLPSLLELSRNQARDHLALKFLLNTSKKYMYFIKTLDLPTYCKDILIFRRPVYLSNKQC